MRLIDLGVALVLGLLAGAPAVAAHHAGPPAVGAKAAEELAALWRDVCLEAFPGEDAVTALAARRRFRVMTELEAQAYLHGAAGRGWYYRTPRADYAVLVQREDAPSCSVRRMTPNGLPSAHAYFAARDGWVASRPGTLQALDPQQGTGPGGTESEGIGSALVDPSGRTTDVFLAVVTEYHGRYHGHDAPSARGGPGVEVRLVHSLGRASGRWPATRYAARPRAAACMPRPPERRPTQAAARPAAARSSATATG